jgi:hypothetical protein
MRASSLAAAPHLYNPAYYLADLFELSFHYYLAHPLLDATPFIQDLRNLVDSGFAICRTDEECLMLYQDERKCFMKCGDGDFRQSPAMINSLAHVITSIIALTLEKNVHSTRYPGEFFRALDKVADNTAIQLLGKQKEVQHTLEALWAQKPSANLT